MIPNKFKSSIAWRLYAIFISIIIPMSALGSYVYYFKTRDVLIYDKLLANLTRIGMIPQQSIEVVGNVTIYMKAPSDDKETDIIAAIDDIITVTQTVLTETNTDHEDSIHLIEGILNILHNMRRISKETLDKINVEEYDTKVLEAVEYLNVIVDVIRENVARYISSELLHAAKVRQNINQLNKTLGFLLVFFVVLNFLFILLLVMVVRKSIIKPIQNLEQSVNRLENNAAFAKIDVTASDEIGSLSKAFNKMAAQLHASMEEIKESEERYRSVYNTAPLAFVVWDKACNVLEWNDQAEIMFGYRRRDVLGKNFFDLIIPSIAKDAVQQVVANLLNGKIESHVINQNSTKDGELIWCEWNNAILHNSQGEIIAALSLGLDITDRVNAENELKEYREHLERMVEERTTSLEVKNKELETFTYSVSHDLKAPLRGIDGYSRLLMEEYAEKLDEEGLTFLKNVRKSTEQMNQLIEDLLAYSRMERRETYTATIKLDPLIESLTSERQHEIESNQININVSLPFASIEGDADTVRQIIGNYLDNAIKFSKKQGRPTVEISGVENTDSWQIWVKDNGIGFDPHYHDRIFQIFQRLHRIEDYPGTGIGLAIARKAVERIGGRVWAESKPGEGATFFVEIPKPDEEKHAS